MCESEREGKPDQFLSTENMERGIFTVSHSITKKQASTCFAGVCLGFCLGFCSDLGAYFKT